MPKGKQKTRRVFSEKHRLKHIRKQAKKEVARWRRWCLLHPELAPEGTQINWDRLSLAKRLRILENNTAYLLRFD